MRWRIQWQGDAVNAAADERVTVADFGLWLGDVSATTHIVEGDQRVQDEVTVALCHVANALAHQWWEIFGGRDRWFRLMPHRGGYALPDVRMTFDGSAFEIESRQYGYRNPRVRFWEAPRETLARGDAESELGRLIAEIIARMTERGVEGSSASLRWSRVLGSLGDPDETAFCEAAGAMGLDPYKIDEAGTAIIEAASDRFKSEALIEFLAGARGARADHLFDWIETVERRRPHCSRVGNLRDIATKAAEKAPPKVNEPGWALGYRRASALRDVIPMDQTERFVGFRRLAEKLGAGKSYQLARAVDGLRALRADRPDAIHIHMREHGRRGESRAAHTFSFARAVGDAVCFPEPTERAPVNDLHAAHRQAAGRAFAAELLAPIEELRSMQADGHDTVSMAEEFGVAIHVIERQIENQHRIDEALAA